MKTDERGKKMGKDLKDYTLDEIFQKVEEVLNKEPGPTQGIQAVYQYEISGEGGGTYQLHLSDGKAKVEKGEAANADCTLQMSLDDFRDLLLGNLNGTAAFMAGKLKVKGNLGLAMKMEHVLRQYDVKQYS